MSKQELTRPPDDHDLVFVANELNSLGAKYIVIGGLAINRLGFVRATDDLDLLISKEKENQAKVKAALTKLPDQAIKELGDEDLASWIVVRINDEITIDLMTEASGIDYDEAKDEVDWIDLKGVTIPFANKSLMLRFKQSTREKDVLDRKFLEGLD